MALDGLVMLACAALVAAPPEPAPRAAVASTLAVQMALNRGRDLLFHGDAKGAVEALEGQLARINGNREYLAALRDAYREYAKELVLKDQPALAEKYRQRLAILDPDAARSLVRTATAPVKPNPASPAPRGPTFRGKSDDKCDDPFDPAHQKKETPVLTAGPGRLLGDKAGPSKAPGATATALVDQAEVAFRGRRYEEGLQLFEKANRMDPAALASSRAAWAYCKMNHVVERLNATGQEPGEWAALEKEVRTAQVLAPQLDKTAQWLLQQIQERSQGKTAAAEAALQVQHLARNAQGWYVAETGHFRLYHNQPRALVEKVAQAAEQTRVAMSRKWFATPGEPWEPKCAIFLHSDGKEYNRLTGQPATFPGHSRIETDRDTQRVIARRIDLRCDNPDMLGAVLPHETTHVVLAGHFGRFEVPRWADEGMAVLTEPAAKLDQHRQNLARSKREGQLFAVRDLMQMNDYPRPSLVGAFYAQSVSLVDFLAKERGSVVFARFLRDALEEGYEPALRKHYQYQNFEELETRWSRQSLAEGAQTVGLQSGYSR